MLFYRNMNITHVTEGVVLHGCNRRLKMGSGAALDVRRKWPEVYDAYMSYGDPENIPPLGEHQWVWIHKPKLAVVNGFTQDRYGYDKKRYADPQAIEKIIKDVIDKCMLYQLRELFMTRIGSDRGGLNWQHEVLPIVLDAANRNKHVNIVVCSKT